MKKVKLLATLLMSATLLFTGCASNFSEAIGNVTDETRKKTSLLTYRDKTISEKIAKFNAYFEELNIEISASQTPEKLNDKNFWNDDAVKSTKEKVLKDLKMLLALNVHASDYGVKLTDEENQKIEDSAKTILGQTYKNIYTEFFNDKGFELNENVLKEVFEMQQIAGKVQTELLNNTNVDKNIEHVVEYSRLVVPVNSGGDEAKTTADKIKEELSANKDIDQVANTYGIKKLDGIEVQGITSMEIPEEVQKQILGLKTGDISVIESKSDGKVTAYYVVKIKAVDTDEAKEKAKTTQEQTLKQTKAMEILNGWMNEIHVNESIMDGIKFNVNRDFWKKFQQNTMTGR